MSIVGEATGVIGLLEKAWNLLRDHLDPARAQAKRLIESFGAYGIARERRENCQSARDCQRRQPARSGLCSNGQAVVQRLS